jgi:alpha-L-fucosidase
MIPDERQMPPSRTTASGTFLFVLLTCLAAALVRVAAGETDLLKAAPEQMQRWQDARFGMFVCWGPVSLTGREIGWSRGKARPDQAQGGRGPTPVEVYDNLYRQWKPDKFNARQWVKVANDGGMKYMIFLVRHHDGFSLYDTKLSDYKSTSPEAAWRHDVMLDIADACHAAGLKLIVYYSQPDWYHPDYRTENHARFIRYLHGQIAELLTNYGRIDGLWFDGLGGSAEDWDAANLFRMARGLQPWLIINNRCGLPGDYDTPEQRLGRFQLDRPWETCMTLGTQWSWKTNDTIKSLKQCVDALVSCAVRGGNLALNTNPMPDGRIEPRQVERFREIGRWLKKYGQTIYATRGGPSPSASWGGMTHRDNLIFVHVLQWPGERLTLPPIPQKVVASSVVTGGKVTVNQTDAGVEIVVPPSDRQALDTIVSLKLDARVADDR